VIDPVALKAVVKALVLPPTGLLLLSIAGLALAKRLPRLGHALAWTGVLALLVLSLPVVSGLLLETLDREPPFTVERASGAQAIVILGGGTRRNAPDYGGDTLGRLTLERVRYGANVARLTGLPVMVTGGSVLGGEPEARLMREALQREFAIPVRWVEDRSRTTHENAMGAPLLRASRRWTIARACASALCRAIATIANNMKPVNPPAKNDHASHHVETILSAPVYARRCLGASRCEGLLSTQQVVCQSRSIGATIEALWPRRSGHRGKGSKL